MTHEPQRFVVTDPRTFDGNAFEVAQRAVDQVLALARLTELSLGPTVLMARNAELERQMALGDEPDAAAWEQSTQAKQFASAVAELQNAQRRLRVLRRAVAFDPKHPPRA